MGLGGAANVFSQSGRPAVLLRQRPGHSGSPGGARRPLGLPGCVVQQPSSGLRAVPGSGSGNGGRECSPHQARSAFPRWPAGA